MAHTQLCSVCNGDGSTGLVMTASGVDENACPICRGSGRISDTRMINVCTFNGATRQTWECLDAEISNGGTLARIRDWSGKTLFARRAVNQFGEFWYVVRSKPAFNGYGV